MKYSMVFGVAMAAALFATSPAFAGGPAGGGNPPPSEDPGETPGGDEGGPGGGGPGSGGPTPGPGGSGGGYTSAVGANVYDLENYSPARPGGYNVFNYGFSASQTVNGLTLSLTPSTSATLALGDESAFTYLGLPAAEVGHQSAFDFGFGPSQGPLYANFSSAISDFSLMAYKIAGDYSPVITLTAYSGLNGTGTSLGTRSASFGGLNYQSSTFALTGLSGAQSIAFSANTRGNVWFDNFSATAAAIAAPAPEPATWAMMIMGFGVVGATMRRRRSAAVKVAYSA